MITVSGQTWSHRDLLRELGGRFDKTARHWIFDRLDYIDLKILRDTVGLSVTDHRKPPRRNRTEFYGDDRSYLGYFRDPNPTEFFGFSSLRKFVDFVAALPVPSDPENTRAYGIDPKRAEFTATANMDEALELGRRGWSGGLGLAQKFDIPAARAFRRLRGVAGGRVNVGRLLAGNPVNMVRRARQPREKIITLFVDVMMWRGITAINAIMRALLIGGMIDVLEAEGYQCEIIAVACDLDQDRRKPCTHTAVRIKEANQPLTLTDLTFALGHPSFLRRLCFALEEGCLLRPAQAIISAPFDDNHQPGPNEFYIPQLTGLAQSAIGDDPFDMLEFIEPNNLPIKIKERL